ncbi:hypothetical protein [Pelagimonas sp. KU-00592-HH]|uniref:hypothetical protein n=1 Tax=Pelagimonas sp. KU-00592-HH TaxID=3127651 RepID=UPI0033405A41
MSIPDLVSSATKWLSFLNEWVAGDETATIPDPDGVDRDSPRKQVQALVDAAETDISNNVAGMSVQSYGTTADRPNLGAGVYYQYFDTTLGKPIWWKSTGWVDATGAAV